VAALTEHPDVVLVNPVLEWAPGGFAYITDELRVLFKISSSEEAIQVALTDLGLEVSLDLEPSDRRQTLRKTASDGDDIIETANHLYESGLVEYAQPNFACTGTESAIPNDVYFPFLVDREGQWYLRDSIGDTLYDDHDIDADFAWNMPNAQLSVLGSPDVVIATLDVGYHFEHPDLEGLQRVEEYDPAGQRADQYDPDNDAQAYCDYWYPETSHCWHATSCMGMIFARTNNWIGIAGLAPNSSIMPIKTRADDGLPLRISDFANGQDHIVKFAGWVDIVVCTQNFLEDSEVAYYFEELYSNGIVTICSGGTADTVVFPATLDWVQAVAMTDRRDKRWDEYWFNPYGPKLDLVAPGIDVMVLDLVENDGWNPNSGYRCPDIGTLGYLDYWCYQVGTSFAAPLCAGVAALVYSRRPDLRSITGDPATIIEILQNSAEDQVSDDTLDVPGWDQYYGHGRVNAYRALLAVSRGEINSDGVWDVEDVVLVVEEAFRGQPPQGCHPGLADFNCDSIVNVLDVVQTVNLVFRNGDHPAPCYRYDY
ncbi:MAG TPA: S8 family serine peptidase, partial [Acidobacteriota bacterium]|nr:S8 family serine peptidase [Acidobacteriota bacterium]